MRALDRVTLGLSLQVVGLFFNRWWEKQYRHQQFALPLPAQAISPDRPNACTSDRPWATASKPGSLPGGPAAGQPAPAASAFTPGARPCYTARLPGQLGPIPACFAAPRLQTGRISIAWPPQPVNAACALDSSKFLAPPRREFMSYVVLDELLGWSAAGPASSYIFVLPAVP